MKHKIIFKALVGSQAQGTSTPTSDEDYKGIYMQPISDLITYGYEEFVKVNSDETYYEIRRFLDLLCVANPEALELLFSPDDCILVNSPQFELIREHKDRFITKLCAKTFANYAYNQIKKSKGTDKKMNWKEQKIERKTPLDFCYVHFKGKTVPLECFLENNGMKQDKCGLVKLNHMDNTYGLYYDYYNGESFKGIIGENSNELRLSSVTKEYADAHDPYVLFYNKNGYSTHCKDYLSYQQWLKECNPNRFHTNKSHGQVYDSKNLSHCRRLIDIAIEIGKTGTFSVKRPNVDYLLEIKRGDVPLDTIIEDAERDIAGLDELFKNSSLPDDVDKDFVKELLLEVRMYVEPVKKIGVVCYTTDEFNKWKIEQGHQPIHSKKNYYEWNNNAYYCIIIGDVSRLCSLVLNDIIYIVPYEKLPEHKNFWEALMYNV